MTEHVTAIDRRQYPREGVMAELENITYAALRRNAVIGQVKTGQMNSPNQPNAVIQ